MLSSLLNDDFVLRLRASWRAGVHVDTDPAAHPPPGAEPLPPGLEAAARGQQQLLIDRPTALYVIET